MTDDELKAVLNNCDEEVIKIIMLANQHALKLGHTSVSIEHLLLALVESKSARFDMLLTKANVDPELIRQEVESRLARATWIEDASRLPVLGVGIKCLPSALSCMQEAFNESLQLKTHLVNTKQFLLGCAKTGCLPYLSNKIENIRAVFV